MLANLKTEWVMFTGSYKIDRFGGGAWSRHDIGSQWGCSRSECYSKGKA